MTKYAKKLKLKALLKKDSKGGPGMMNPMMPQQGMIEGPPAPVPPPTGTVSPGLPSIPGVMPGGMPPVPPPAPVRLTNKPHKSAKGHSSHKLKGQKKAKLKAMVNKVKARKPVF